MRMYYAPICQQDLGFLFSSKPLSTKETVNLIFTTSGQQVPKVGLTTLNPVSVVPDHFNIGQDESIKEHLVKMNELCSFWEPNIQNANVGDILRLKMSPQQHGKMLLKFNNNNCNTIQLDVENGRNLYVIIGPCTDCDFLRIIDDAQLAYYLAVGNVDLPKCSRALQLFRPPSVLLRKTPKPSTDNQSTTPSSPQTPPDVETSVLAPPPGLEDVSPTSTEPTQKETCQFNNKCKVCLAESACIMTVPCGHIVTCKICSSELEQNLEKYPSTFLLSTKLPKCICCRSIISRTVEVDLDHERHLCGCNRLCSYCKKEKISAVTSTCGHMVACSKCLNKFKNFPRMGLKRPNCSICDKQIVSLYEGFFC